MSNFLSYREVARLKELINTILNKLMLKDDNLNC